MRHAFVSKNKFWRFDLEKFFLTFLLSREKHKTDERFPRFKFPDNKLSVYVTLLSFRLCRFCPSENERTNARTRERERDIVRDRRRKKNTRERRVKRREIQRENISAAEERERERREIARRINEKRNASHFSSKPRGGGVGVDGEDAEGNAGENRAGAKILLRRED